MLIGLSHTTATEQTRGFGILLIALTYSALTYSFSCASLMTSWRCNAAPNIPLRPTLPVLTC